MAEYIYIETEVEVVKTEDWSKPTKQLKEQVEKLRKTLGCN